jgi:hypothetical protein
MRALNGIKSALVSRSVSKEKRQDELRADSSRFYPQTRAESVRIIPAFRALMGLAKSADTLIISHAGIGECTGYGWRRSWVLKTG